MKRIVVFCALLAAVAGGIRWALPPKTLSLTASAPAGVRGAIHIHTRRSDGSGTVEQVAAAAARAGLQFVILTDHGDGTRTPSRAAYHSNVLVVDGVEIGGEDGHVVALGLSKTPYPLRGEVRDIVEDVARLGGMSVAAHPGSPKPGLRWTEWASPFSGLEWLNGDSEYRDERWASIVRALFTYPFEASATLASLLDRPDTLLRRWDALTSRRRVVALAGIDAHARLDVRGDESGGRLAMFPVPGYESLFRTVSVTVAGVKLTRDAEQDATALVDAIRQGHVYSTIDALATPGAVSFTAARGTTVWTAGDFVPPEGGDIELRVDTNAPQGSTIVLMKDGDPAERSMDRTLRRVVPARPAVYRVEVQVAGAPGVPPVPWVLTNPIYVRSNDESPVRRSDAAETALLYGDGEARGWRIEVSPRSKAALDVVRTVDGSELLLRWGLGGTEGESPYAAVAMPVADAINRYDRLSFTSRADRPMRLSVQFRIANGERWRRSVYLDDTPRQIAVFFDDVRPAGSTSQRRLPIGSVKDVLFVVDTVNTNPGASGQVWIDDVKYGR